MKPYLFTLCFFLLTLPLISQSLEEVRDVLKEVDRIEQLEVLKQKFPEWVILSDKTLFSDSLRFPNIIKTKVGSIVEKQHRPGSPSFLLKILNIEEEELCKVKYIYLDGSKYSKTKIDSIRNVIIKRYNDGEDYELLVEEYNMDGNSKGGDTPWFYKGMMVDEFDVAVRNKSKGKIFIVDVEKNNWFYVVLKTHDNKIEKSINGIEIKYIEE